MLRRLSREPLAHFILVGAALFALHRLVSPPPPGRTIEISAELRRGLAADHLRRTGKAPDARDEAAEVARYAEDEALYREALARGLDRGDVIVRRRLIQKMELLLDAIDPPPQPSDAQLQEWLNAHRASYTVPARISLTQVFVARDRHPDPAGEATALRTRLLGGADPATLGDPFLRGQVLRARSESELAGIFGPDLAQAIFALPTGTWSSPLESAYGFHLVHVEAHTQASQPALDAVRERVLREFLDDARAERAKRTRARLLAKYRIVE